MDEPAKVALITGGARRVGRAVALHLAAAGYDVAVTFNRSGADAASLAESIEQLGRRCLPIRADLTDLPAATDRVAAEVNSYFGRLDLLVHNASLYEPSRATDIDLALLRQFWSIHLEAPLLLTRRLAPLLRVSRGTVVTMTDAATDRPMPAFAAYFASKAGLENLTKSLARDLAPDVTVNALAPGVVEWADDVPETVRDAYLKRVPLGRIGSGRDVAEAVTFLAGAGKYLTGQVIRLDGGRSLR